MLGIIIGVVASIVMLTFFGKDQRAVKQNKQRKKKQAEQRQEQQKKRQKQLQKIQNDPQLKKKRQEQKQLATKKRTQIKQKLMKNMNQKDRSLFEQYMNQHRKTGKSDEQILKDATNKAGLMMFGLTLIVILIIICMFILIRGGDQDFQVFFTGVKHILQALFPKLKLGENNAAGISSGGMQMKDL